MTSRFLQVAVPVAAIFLLLVGYNACGQFSVDSDSVDYGVLSSISCDDKLAYAYERGLHSFFARNCSDCHSSVVSSSAPGDFADPTVSVGFRSFYGQGFGTTPTKWAQIAINATDDQINHQGRGGSHLLAEFSPGQRLWNLALKVHSEQCEGAGPGHRTIAIPWVAADAEAGTYAEQVLPLDELDSGYSLPGASLIFESRHLDEEDLPFGYGLRELRMKNGSQSVRVKTLKVYFNGEWMPNVTSYLAVDVTLEPDEEVSLLPPGSSPLFLELLDGGTPGVDEISFEFELIELL